MRLLKKIIGLMTCFALVAGTISFSPFHVKAADRKGETYQSKKGMQVEIGTMSDVEDMGISEALINIVFERFISIGETDVKCSAGGNTFSINKSELEILDSAISDLNKMGANVTVAFINQYNPEYTWMLYTGEAHEGTADYGFAINNDLGKNAVSAVSKFVAERYNGGEHGTVSRFVIGNEVNDNEAYNWVGAMDIDSYVDVYYQTFKLFSEGIKSGNPNALVYVPIEHMWNVKNTDTSYAGRDFLTKFNSRAKADGVDWNLAFHAYSEPLCNPNPLRDGSPIKNEKGESVPAGIVENSQDTMAITMRNLNVLTDFMQKDEMKNSAGEVRSIILSEQGFTSNSRVAGDSETLQAAAVAYAYYVAEMNPYIDAFILYSYIEPFLDNDINRFGIRNRVGDTQVPAAPKRVYYVYKYIDTKDSLAVTNFALSTLGIEDWKYAIKDFDASRFDSMKTIDNGSLYSVTSMDAAVGQNVLSSGMATGDLSNNISNVYWNPGYYVHTLSAYDYEPHCEYYPNMCVAVGDKDVYAISAQTVYHEFSTPLDLSAAPYLGFTIGFDDRNEQSEKLNVRFRIYSGAHVYDANTNVNSGNYATDGTSFTLFANLSDWAYKNAIDKVSVWISESDKDTSFDGTFFVKDFSTATSLTDAKEEAIGKDTSKKLLDPYPYLDQPWANKWGDLDLSGEYNWEEYYNSNPDIAAKLGKSPVLLIEAYANNTVPEYVDMYRLYNPNSGEHFYTSSKKERDNLTKIGWTYEGVAWSAPAKSSKPVYRLYNQNSGEHHYTMSWKEVVHLYTVGSGNDTGEDVIGWGWDYEGIGWYSDEREITPLYRLYNPNATGDMEPGSHHYTKSKKERDKLISQGWKDEGIGWYGGQ